ncbi:hypothetical protein OH76DRAFT_1402880 [Lentinus brumalis]|uniref:Uncharacterized protein n=1 Tax=Lentinus brumalis TaxID=2498619 RepID=A0A371DBY2_9APHY|nr:hypothetical protein OH76DRAFT_1402880 [Polyporus brumalis]
MSDTTCWSVNIALMQGSTARPADPIQSGMFLRSAYERGRRIESTDLRKRYRGGHRTSDCTPGTTPLKLYRSA